jgi:hypothetical protein
MFSFSFLKVLILDISNMHKSRENRIMYLSSLSLCSYWLKAVSEKRGVVKGTDCNEIPID